MRPFLKSAKCARFFFDTASLLKRKHSRSENASHTNTGRSRNARSCVQKSLTIDHNRLSASRDDITRVEIRTAQDVQQVEQSARSKVIRSGGAPARHILGANILHPTVSFAADDSHEHEWCGKALGVQPSEQLKPTAFVISGPGFVTPSSRMAKTHGDDRAAAIVRIGEQGFHSANQGLRPKV
jgi:hypothetical protein